MELMQEHNRDELTADQIADAIKDLTDDDREALQRVCGLLVHCFGENATRKAVLVVADNSVLSLYNLNADVQDTYEVLRAAYEALNEKVIGEIPPKEMMN